MVCGSLKNDRFSYSISLRSSTQSLRKTTSRLRGQFEKQNKLYSFSTVKIHAVNKVYKICVMDFSFCFS